MIKNVTHSEFGNPGCANRVQFYIGNGVDSAQGGAPSETTLTAGNLSACIGLDLALERRGDRWFSWLP